MLYGSRQTLASAQTVQIHNNQLAAIIAAASAGSKSQGTPGKTPVKNPPDTNHKIQGNQYTHFVALLKPFVALWRSSFLYNFLLLLVFWAACKHRGYSVVRKTRLVPKDKFVRIGNTEIVFPVYGCVSTEHGLDWRFVCPYCTEKNLKVGDCESHARHDHADRLNIEEHYRDLSLSSPKAMPVG
jgi:hypothetical protein